MFLKQEKPKMNNFEEKKNLGSKIKIMQVIFDVLPLREGVKKQIVADMYSMYAYQKIQKTYDFDLKKSFQQSQGS